MQRAPGDDDRDAACTNSMTVGSHTSPKQCKKQQPVCPVPRALQAPSRRFGTGVAGRAGTSLGKVAIPFGWTFSLSVDWLGVWSEGGVDAESRRTFQLSRCSLGHLWYLLSVRNHRGCHHWT